MKFVGSLLWGLLITSESFAATFSANVVGYHTRDVPTGAFCTISNPLNGTNNHFNTVLRLPSWAQGTTVYRWDRATQSWLDSVEFFEDYGWFSPSDPSPTLNPGEGTFISVPPNSSSAHLRIEFVGELPSRALCPTLPGRSRFTLWGPMFCQRLADFLPQDGDTLYIWNCPPESNYYRDPWTYFEGFGWFNPSDPNPGPEGPVIPPGSAVFLQLQGSDRNWCGRPCLICGAGESLAAQPVRLEDPNRAGTTFSFQMQTETNVTYQVQFTSDPCSPPWNPLGAVTGNGQRITVTDSNAVALTRFYRVAVP